jgi:hypothetical protein
MKGGPFSDLDQRETSMRFEIDRVRENVRKASTQDLLDRVTVDREGMEPEALEIIEAELRSRGVDSDDITRHGETREREVLFGPGNVAQHCSFCPNPAVGQGWKWHRLWGLLPVFPRPVYFCEAHRPR